METLFLSNILGKDDEGKSDIVYHVKLVKKSDYGRTDVQEAMQKEIEKYNNCDAIEIVNDEGQKSVPIQHGASKLETGHFPMVVESEIHFNSSDHGVSG